MDAVTLSCLTTVELVRADEAAKIRVGAAVVDITPSKFYPISMLGSFGDRKATSAHDPLEVRAMVLDDGRTRIAIAICDNCVIPRELMDQAKELAAQRTQFPTDRMLIAATHTHSAPAVITLSDIPVDIPYTKFLVAQIAEAIAQAASQPQPAQIGSAEVPVPEEVFNRRWLMKEGAIAPNPLPPIVNCKSRCSANVSRFRIDSVLRPDMNSDSVDWAMPVCCQIS